MCATESTTTCATESGVTDRYACTLAAAGHFLHQGVAVGEPSRGHMPALSTCALLTQKRALLTRALLTQKRALLTRAPLVLKSPVRLPVAFCLDCSTSVDFSSVASVVSGTCTACTSADPSACSAAACAAGFRTYAGGSCTACSPGRFNSEYGQTTCDLCDFGTFSAEQGLAADCGLCAVGAFNSELGRTVCKACTAGMFNSEEGRAFCDACAAGKYGTEAGQLTAVNSCTECPSGLYSGNAGRTYCQYCTTGNIIDMQAMSAAVLGAGTAAGRSSCSAGFPIPAIHTHLALEAPSGGAFCSPPSLVTPSDAPTYDTPTAGVGERPRAASRSPPSSPSLFRPVPSLGPLSAE